MTDGLHSINAYLINNSCAAGQSCPFPGFQGEIDYDNGRVTSNAAMLKPCLAATTDIKTNCPGGGMDIESLEKIAGGLLGLSPVYDKISVANTATNADRLAWVSQMIVQQYPIIVHVGLQDGAGS